RSRNSKIADWPIVAMLPGLARNVHRVHDFIAEVLAESGGTFVFRGPVFGNTDMLVTSDPANVHYILSKNFHNFGKGPDFKKIFDILGDGIFAAEFESWEKQRRAAKAAVGNLAFHQFVARTVWGKVSETLVPMLRSASENEETIDLQTTFERLAFDTTCMQVLGHDPCSLSEEMPHLGHERAFSDAEEAILYRHFIPEVVWNLQKRLQIGTEKRLSAARMNLDAFLYRCISERERRPNTDLDQDVLARYMRGETEGMHLDKEMLRDSALSFLTAGKDTISAALTWFFWLVAMNPDVEYKIRREIRERFAAGEWSFAAVEEVRRFVYLHAALCETLRLYPPVGLQHKAPLKDDVLPSGHRVKANARTVISFHSMGRMESIWGKDSGEFRPDRWISGDGTIKLVPSFMFPAFNAGPRSCLGKEISFMQLKIVAAAVISRFTIRAAEGNRVLPRASVILHMKYGLRVRVYK
ncbi:hypothetical protein M569_14105, partial [Genlisea aurea]